jgi:murein DD-endopeptidase MepM/ murein hydrolase activator NlpD
MPRRDVPALYARPRHAAPRDHSRIRAALVPAVLLASTGSALGGLAVGASADDGVLRVTSASATAPAVDVEALVADRALVVEQAGARANRSREIAAQRAAEAAALAQLAEDVRRVEEARLAEEARVAAEIAAAEQQAAERAAAEQAAAEAAAAPKFARPGVGRLTSGFGNRWGRLHAGIDLAAGTGSPIRAAAEGVVESTGNEGGYGQTIRIQHADGTQTLYAHLSAITVGAGQQVAAGEEIGREGNTGASTGPHLHFEVRIGGNPVDPAVWLQQRGVNL